MSTNMIIRRLTFLILLVVIVLIAAACGWIRFYFTGDIADGRTTGVVVFIVLCGIVAWAA